MLGSTRKLLVKTKGLCALSATKALMYILRLAFWHLHYPRQCFLIANYISQLKDLEEMDLQSGLVPKYGLFGATQVSLVLLLKEECFQAFNCHIAFLQHSLATCGCIYGYTTTISSMSPSVTCGVWESLLNNTELQTSCSPFPQLEKAGINHKPQTFAPVRMTKS